MTIYLGDNCIVFERKFHSINWRNQAYKEVKINPRSNRYLNNVFLKAYYKFFIPKIRLITKRILNPKNVFITQNLPDITKKIAEQTNCLPASIH
jgi:hypothetical protein